MEEKHFSITDIIQASKRMKEILQAQRRDPDGLYKIDFVANALQSILKDEFSDTEAIQSQEEGKIDASQSAFEIVLIDTKVTESNDIWWKFAWILKIHNATPAPILLDATIEFLDSEGFVIDDCSEYGMSILPVKTASFTGYKLVDVPGALNVSSINAKVKLQ